MAKNVREITKEYLEENGYDGLFGSDCGCSIDDLMPCCSESIMNCEAGYKVKCDPETCEADGDCEFHIGPTPEEVTDG